MTPLSRSCAAALITLSLAGCHAAVSNPTTPPNDAPKPGYSNSSEFWPFEFRAHKFGVATYSTYDCKVIYDGGIFSVDDEGVLQIASSSVSKYPDVLHASAGPYRNFPPPIIVTWRSSDGAPHRADVDIGEIFKDQLVRHNVAREDVGENGNDAVPGIILEVNDRTINVYMRAMIWTKAEQIPGNQHSRYRDDLIKVYTRTY